MLFDDYEWGRVSTTSLDHPKPGIDAFLSIIANEYEVLRQGYQLLIRKISPTVLDYPIVSQAIIPILMIVTDATASRIASLIRSIITHSLAPSMLRFVLINCASSRREFEMLEVPLTWVPGFESCSAVTKFLNASLLNVYDLCPTVYSSYIFVADTARLFTGDVSSFWQYAPAVASVAGFSLDPNRLELSMEVAVINRARFGPQAKVVAVMSELGTFKTQSPWNTRHFSFAHVPLFIELQLFKI
jgi:hypothetical protein